MPVQSAVAGSPLHNIFVLVHFGVFIIFKGIYIAHPLRLKFFFFVRASFSSFRLSAGISGLASPSLMGVSRFSFFFVFMNECFPETPSSPKQCFQQFSTRTKCRFTEMPKAKNYALGQAAVNTGILGSIFHAMSLPLQHGVMPIIRIFFSAGGLRGKQSV